MVFFSSVINQYFSEAEGTIVLENLRQIVQIVDDDHTQFLSGKNMNNVKVCALLKFLGKLMNTNSVHGVDKTGESPENPSRVNLKAEPNFVDSKNCKSISKSQIRPNVRFSLSMVNRNKREVPSRDEQFWDHPGKGR